MRPRVLVAALAGLLLASCTSTADTSSRSPDPDLREPTTSFSQDAAGAWDLHRRDHARPFFALGRRDLRLHYSRLEARAGEMDRAGFLVELMRVTARSGREGGRDGHSGVFPLDYHVPELHLYPLQLYWFPEGLFVTEAFGSGRDLVGAELLAIEGVPIGRIVDLVEPLVPRDNRMTMRARLPQFLLTQEVLDGLDVVSPGGAELTFASGGDTLRRTLEPVDAGRYAESAGYFNPMIPALLPAADRPLYLRHRRRDFHLDYLGSEDALYVQYNVALQPTDDFADDVRRLFRTRRPAKVVVDVRHNPGGENFTYESLVRTLAAIAKDAEVYVLLGRGTFSAAGHFVIDLMKRSDVRLVGERSGFAPNQFGDPDSTLLAASGLTVNAGTVEWIKTRRDDRRLWLAPHLPVRVRAADFFGGRDPVLEAALAD